jgi:HSP20 family protein
MRYRRLSYRYTTVSSAAHAWPLDAIWPGDRLRLLTQGRWWPDADAYETARTLEVVVDLAGLDDEHFEVQLFEDAVVVQGRRELPGRAEGARYHAATIRQGPFALALPLPVPVDAERVTARYERGLLSITLPKRGGGATD